MTGYPTSAPTDRPTDRLESIPLLPAQIAASRRRHFAIAGGRAGRLRQQLSDRDMELLSLLRRSRLASGQQLRCLFYSNGNPVTQARKCRAALMRLVELRLVVRTPRRVGGLHAGSDGQVLGLSGLGQAVLDVGSDIKRRHRSVADTKLAHQEHVLAVTQLIVELNERARSGQCKLLQLDAEPGCWRRFSGIGGQRITLKPDAFVQLAVDEWEIAAFIEQDMATESLPTITRKCGVYVDYWRSGQEQRDHGVFPRIWWLVPDVARLKAIARATQRLPSEARNIFTIALTSDAAEQLVQLPSTGTTS